MYCFKRSFFAIVLLAFVTCPILAQQTASSQNSATAYNPSALHLGAQFGSGVLLGAAGGTVGFFGGAVVAPVREDRLDFRPVAYAALGSYVGYSLSSAFGVYMVANSKPYNASFGSILLGHTIGMGVGFGTFALIDSPAAFVVALSTPIIGGMIANNNSIQRRDSNKTALLNILDGNASLSTPTVKLTKVGTHKLPSSATSYSPTVNLLNISF